MKTLASIALAATVATTACTTKSSTPTCESIIGLWGEMPDLGVLVGDTVEISLEDHFRPVRCLKHYADHDRYWAVQSADSSAVAVARAGAILEVTTLAVADSVHVTVDLHPFGDVGAPDPFDVQRHEFFVRVRPR